MEAWDSVHFRAQYYVQSAHMMNPALQKELPPIGTVVAYESARGGSQPTRCPGYVAVNVTQSQAGLLSCGFPASDLYAVSHRYDERHRRHCAGR